MSYFTKAILAVVLSATFVTLLPTVKADAAPNRDACQPVYRADTVAGNKEVLICITENSVVYHYGTIDAKPDVEEEVSVDNVVMNSFYIDTLNDTVYEVYITTKDAWYVLSIYPSHSVVYVLGKAEGSSRIELNQNAEINNIWNLKWLLSAPANQ